MNGTLSIDAGDGNDSLTVNSGGQASLGLTLLNYSAGSGANSLVLEQGAARIDSTATGGTLNSTVQAGAQLTTGRLNQNGLTISGDGSLTISLASATPINGSKGSVILLEFRGADPDVLLAGALVDEQRARVVSH